MAQADPRKMLMNPVQEEAYISLGSNAANSRQKLDLALQAIAGLPGVKIRALSPRFLTEPQDYREQDWFSNQCVKVGLEKGWGAENFLGELLRLESGLGREREKAIRFGPRAIDLDLLLFGQRVAHSAFCQLPHPGMHRRAFVLLPLYLMEPCLRLYGKSLDFWLSRLSWRVAGNKIWQDQI